MSTDLYGVRVLDVAPGELRARFRIFVVYYECARKDHAPLPDGGDVGFFFRLLWEAAHDRPIAQWHALQAVPLDDFLDPEWVDANAHLYVRRAERSASRNHPVGDGDWDGLHDFYYERDGGWKDEDRLVQADYDVHVTDARFLESLAPGYSWGTTSYVTDADMVAEPDAPTLVDLRRAARVLDPFPGGHTDAATPSDLAFSDDGEYLAVTSEDCELVVYRAADWSEHRRVPHAAGIPWGQDVQWVPGTHLLTKRVLELGSEPPTTAYDVDTGDLVDVPPQPGEARSPSGRYRVDFPGGGDVEFAAAPDGTPRRVGVPGGHASVLGASFTADETRMFVGKGKDVHVLDPASGRVLRTLPGSMAAEDPVVRPDGTCLVTYGNEGWPTPEKLDLRHAEDGRLLMRCRPKGHHYIAHLAWAPDGRTLAATLIEDRNGHGGEVHLFEPGAALTVPEAGDPSRERLRARLDRTSIPEDILLLTGRLADLEDDPAEKAGLWRRTAEKLAKWAAPPPAAAEAYRRAIEHGGPADAAADGIALSRLLYRERDLDGAVDAARDARRTADGLEGDGRARRLRYLAAVRLADMARTRGGKGDLEEADEAYRVCLELEPDDPWSLLGVGWVATERDDDETARPFLLRAVDGGDTHPEGYAAMLLGGQAKRARDVGEALRWYERAYATDERHAPLAMGHLGELHYWTGDRRGARRWYERMLEVTDQPDLVAEACCRLGEMAAADGDAARARGHLERAVGTGDATFAVPAREILDGLPRN